MFTIRYCLAGLQLRLLTWLPSEPCQTTKIVMAPADGSGGGAPENAVTEPSEVAGARKT